MGYLYEIATTVPAFLKRAHYDAHPPARSKEPAIIPFGDDRQQYCVLWEPDVVIHDVPVIYFHGGAYVFGEAESMEDAANVYNSQGYRFCSVGFREAPFHKFPAMVRDGFNGTKAALSWMENNGIPCERIIVGGTSAGGHLALLVCYAKWLQEAFRFPAERICACINVAGVADAADLLVRPFPTHKLWQTVVDLRHDGRNRTGRREAVSRYSPIDIVRSEAETNDVPAIPMFAVHGLKDTLSPYESQVMLVEAIRDALGEKAVEFLTLEDTRWQHMNTTVTMHKYAVEQSLVLSRLFEWLERHISA